MSALFPACKGTAYRFCVLYLRCGVEHRSAWFHSRDRALLALAVLQKRYGTCVLYVD